MPIFPATHHPTGRAPLRAHPEFPFSNCYHWLGEDMEMDVRIKDGSYPRERGTFTWLPDGQVLLMEDFRVDDITCVDDFLTAQRPCVQADDEDGEAGQPMLVTPSSSQRWLPLL